MSVVTHEYKRVFVWEAPVRLFHWINALTILTLITTGILIGNPPAIMSGVEASNRYWFGVTRFIHFGAAYLFAINFAYRIFWGLFIGNKYANWRVFFPFNKKGFTNMKHVFKTDIFLTNPEKFECDNISIGHNAVAGVSYFLFFVLVVVQVATGFALYADNSTWFLPKLFAWVTPLLGGDAHVRLVHHIVMWFIIMFTVIHVYLVMYHDWLEGRGEVSSMFGGYKFVRKERVKE